MRKLRSAVKITVENRQKRIPISQTKLKRWAEKILRVVGWKKVSLSIVLVRDSEIRRLHRRFMGVDEPTDVLAFGQLEGKLFPQPGIPFLGDVVISIETARRAAPQFGNRWDEEVLLYLCHGILHLMGYRDSTSGRKAEMDRKQQQILKRILDGRWRSKKQKRLF